MNHLRNLLARAWLIVLILFFEIDVTLLLWKLLISYAAWIEGILRFLSVIIVLNIIRTTRHLSSDLPWIILIVLLPVPGTLIYFFVNADMITGHMFQDLEKEYRKTGAYYHQDPEIIEESTCKSARYRGQIRYLAEHSGFPVYRNTGFDYYSLGDYGYPVILEELKKAEKFIFLEYFIIEEGTVWNSIVEILKQKAAEGLDVRVMYDDMGSLTTLPPKYAAELEASTGIKCTAFNQISPILNIIMNHRDHRKILVIDGKTAFTGGMNLADEYINVKKRFGHWKDNCVRIRGEAVWSMTVMFLTNWNALRHTDEDYQVFHVDQEQEDSSYSGYIIPYAENPSVAGITTGQDVYLNMINQSDRYCWIMTPYLIIDDDMMNALILASARGVDVRLITPGIPDKPLIWQITRSFYENLMANGVKVHEYTPGFVHSKVFICDDRIAAVGTLNLDYRSLYLHFENGTLLVDAEQIKDIKADLEDTLSKCHEVTEKDIRKSVIYNFFISFMRLFAPML